MDKKTALDLLGLDATATLAEAKKAYRILAKQYHPDVMGELFSVQNDMDNRMKSINLAYRFIVPLLKLDQPVEKDWVRKSVVGFSESRSPNHKKTERESIFTRCSNFFSRLFFQKSGSGVLIKQKRKPYPKQGKYPFQDVLKKVYTEPFDFEKRKTRPTMIKKKIKKQPFHDYQMYLELRQKMKSAGSAKNFNDSIGKVTEIKPVSRVSPIKND